MVLWLILLAVVGLTNCQLQSHLVPPLQDHGQHLGRTLGHLGQTQAIIHNNARHSLQVHGPNPGHAVQTATVQVQSPSQIVPSLVQSPQQGLTQQHSIHTQHQTHHEAFQNQQQTLSAQTQPKAPEQDVKNHALFYRSANGKPTNKYHRGVQDNIPERFCLSWKRLEYATQDECLKSMNSTDFSILLTEDSKKVEIPGNKTVEEILQWLQTHYKAVNLRKAREDLSRAYLPAELSSTQEPRPFQTQKYNSPQPTTPSSNSYGLNNQRPSTPRQNGFPSTPGYQVQASQQNIGYQVNNQQGYNKSPNNQQRPYQQPFQSQPPYTAAGPENRPGKTYIPPQSSYQPPQSSYQPPTPQYQSSQSQQGYQSSQQTYQPNLQQSYQTTQQTYQQSFQPSQPGYQPTSQNGYQSPSQQGYSPPTPQSYQPTGATQQVYQPSSTSRPSYQSSTSTGQPPYSSTGQPPYSSTGQPTSGPTQQGSYSPTVQPSSPTGPSTPYNPSVEGYPAPSKAPADAQLGYPEPVNTVQPPFFNEDQANNQLTNSYPNQGSSVSPTGTPSVTTATGQGFRPADSSNQQAVGQHPPHIHELNVQCAKESMIVNIEFNEPFNGVIYSKGHHNEPECRYVQPNSGNTKYSFTLNLNSCGTQYIEDFASGNPAYLENTLVIQNEPGILEIWDYIRNVKCLWEGSITQSLSTGLSIDGLNQEVVTFSGDTAKAKLELQAGRGPFSYENINLVRIGDLMTLVITVEGDNGFNIRVGECIATDGQPNSLNRISLTDDRGCTIKDKVMGAFQFTRNPNNGASVAYAFFRAFKFPDVMELAIECSVQLCKTECAPCPDPNQLIEPRRRRSIDELNNRRRRWVQNGTDEVFEELRLRNKIQVFLPEELPSSEMSFSKNEQICITPYVFYSTSSLLLFLTSVSTLAWMYFWYKAMSVHRKH